MNKLESSFKFEENINRLLHCEVEDIKELLL